LTDRDCHICGTCWWEGCENAADWTIELVLKRHGAIVYDGAVDLCHGHKVYAERSGHVNVGWIALEQALARQMAEA
jgi:hypothetical protein